MTFAQAQSCEYFASFADAPFDRFCEDIRIIHDVRNGLHVDMNLTLAKLSMNARRSIHAVASLVLAAHFCRKRTSSQ